VLVFSQQRHDMVRVVVMPDHPDWVYRTGEIPKFVVQVLKFAEPLRDVTVGFAIGPEKMKAAINDSMALAAGTADLKGVTMEKPGFVNCFA
jgi:cephalosporin-C deacetylase